MRTEAVIRDKPAHQSVQLPENIFEQVVANAPLVAVDLLVEDSARRVLLGWRTNPPARDSWFVPGGRVRKNETLQEAFERITSAELGTLFSIDQSIFIGVYQHFYPDNFLGNPHASTHYLALAYRLWSGDKTLSLPRTQHARYHWAEPASVAQDETVHLYTRAYFSTHKKSESGFNTSPDTPFISNHTLQSPSL